MMRPRSGILSANRRRGAVAVMVAICLIPIIGVMAFALDGGVLMSERRHAQTVADDTAHAAACSLYKNYASDQGLDSHGTASSAALAIASANGYANDGTTSVVTISIPPTSGNFLGKAGYAEVVVKFNQTRYFSGIFGSGTIPITARAVARGISLTSPSIILLDPSAAGALTLTGSGKVTATSSIQVNSSNAAALSASNAGYASASAIDITGNYSIPYGTTSTWFSTTPATGQPTMTDPLASLATPAATGTPYGSVSTGNGVYATLNAGVYDSLSINSPGATLNPGTYYIKAGGLTIANGATVLGNGVTIYLANLGGKINIQGGANVTLTPPTSGTYAGVSIFQDRANTQTVSIANGTTSSITGTIYAADAQVAIAGGASGIMYSSQFVAKTMNISNNVDLRVNNTQTTGTTRKLNLVE